MNYENIRREFDEYTNLSASSWLAVGFGAARRNARFVKEAEKSGLLDVYVQDFANAASFRTVFLKMGHNYVFLRNYIPIPYDQIAKAYQEIIKQNGVTTGRFLILKDSSGKRIAKIIMLGDAESNGELAQVMTILKMKNPAIHLGYR